MAYYECTGGSGGILYSCEASGYSYAANSKINQSVSVALYKNGKLIASNSGGSSPGSTGTSSCSTIKEGLVAEAVYTTYLGGGSGYGIAYARIYKQTPDGNKLIAENSFSDNSDNITYAAYTWHPHAICYALI